jgi:hypothetical protein
LGSSTGVQNVQGARKDTRWDCVVACQQEHAMNAASFHLDYPRFQVLETMARSTQHQHSFEQKEAGEIAGHARQQHCHRKRSFGLMYKCPRPTYRWSPQGVLTGKSRRVRAARWGTGTNP